MAARIEVLDAQDHAPALASHGKPCHKGGEDIAQMHTTGRRWRKASHDADVAWAVCAGDMFFIEFHVDQYRGWSAAALARRHLMSRC